MPGVAPAPALFVKIKKLLLNREVMTYLVFGVLTTALNYAVYLGLRRFMPWTAANGIAWVVAVEFAFLTNRAIVFRSKGNYLGEMIQFYLSRLATLGLEYATLFALIDWIGIDDRISKLIANVFVVIGNYVLSKLIVFSRGTKAGPADGKD